MYMYYKEDSNLIGSGYMYMYMYMYQYSIHFNEI